MPFNEDAAWQRLERDYPNATDEQLRKLVSAQRVAYRLEMQIAGQDDDEDVPDDTPTVANCDDWGTGEGRYHGRI